MALILRAATPAAVQEAAGHLLAHGLVVFPTETFYGLGCDPRRGAAVGRVFALKGREPGRALPLLAGARSQIALAAPRWEDVPGAVRLADAFWPGPLALVLSAATTLADGVAAEDGAVAIRWSSHPVAAALALALGFAVVATSANRSGAPPCATAEDAIASLGATNDLFVLEGGRAPGALPSTIVDLRGGDLVVVRRGAITEDRLRRALADAGPRDGC